MQPKLSPESEFAAFNVDDHEEEDQPLDGQHREVPSQQLEAKRRLVVVQVEPLQHFRQQLILGQPHQRISQTILREYHERLGQQRVRKFYSLCRKENRSLLSRYECSLANMCNSDLFVES